MILVLCVCLVSGGVFAAITMDSTKALGCSGAGHTVCEFSMHLGAGQGNERTVVVGVSTEKASQVAISSVTLDGTSGTEVIRNRGDDAANWISTVSLYVFNESKLPGVSGDYTVTATYAAGVNNSAVVAMSLTGVMQVTPEASGNNQGAWPTNTLVITRAATTVQDRHNSWIVDIAHHGNAVTWGTTGSGQTLRVQANPNSTSLGMSTKLITAGGNGFVMGWNGETGSSGRVGHSWLVLAPYRRKMVIGLVE